MAQDVLIYKCPKGQNNFQQGCPEYSHDSKSPCH